MPSHRKPGAPKGNQNAAGDVPADDHLNLRVYSADKRLWKVKAEKENLTLTRWVIRKLSK